MMVEDMRQFTKFVSQVMNSKFYNTLGIWKSGNFVFGIALCLLRATELSQTPQKWQL